MPLLVGVQGNADQMFNDHVVFVEHLTCISIRKTPKLHVDLGMKRADLINADLTNPKLVRIHPTGHMLHHAAQQSKAG